MFTPSGFGRLATRHWLDSVQTLSITSLQWLVGMFIAVLGAMMLVSPHQFAGPTYAPISPQLAWFGPGFLLAGAGLIAVATPPPRSAYVLLAHVFAGVMLMVLAGGFALSGSWSGTSNYGVLGLGTAVAPLLARPLTRLTRTRGEAFSLVLGLATTFTGLILLAMPDQFAASLYDPVRQYLPWYGAGFVVGGIVLFLGQLGDVAPAWLGRWSPLLVAGAFFVFGATVALPSRAWTGIAYYGCFGAAMVVLAWLGPDRRRLDSSTLRTRLALVLGAAAAVPVLVLTPIYSHEEERQAVTTQLARQQALADAIAQEVADYVSLHQAAVTVLAAQPGLLALSPVDQHLVLQSNNAAYPDVNGFGIVSAEGDTVARSDDHQGISWVGDPVFEAARRTNRPSIDIRISPVIHRPVFALGVPVLDAPGHFAGMVSASLESAHLAVFLARNDVGDGAVTYLVDSTGRLIAHPDPDLVASQADLSRKPSVAALLSNSAPGGSFRVAGTGGDVLASFSRVPDLEWGVIVERSTAAALAPTRAKLDLLFGGMLLLIAVAAGFGVIAARWLSQPLDALGAAVNGLAAGNDAAPLPSGGFTEVAVLAGAFGTMRARVIRHTAALEAANKELEAFSYSVSHDLRAPLRAIHGFSRILLEEHAANLGAEAQEYLELVSDNANQMGRLIDDLLRFSRMSRQALRRDLVLTAGVVRDVLGDLASQQEGRRVDFVVGELLPCQADAALLKQVFVNLISNAFKFTRERAVGHIKIGCRRAGGEVVYFVKDDGAGFDMRYAHKLFGVFQRLHRAEDYEGTGVGLAIVQRIVQRHGGRIWAEGALGQGATFSFTLAGARTGAVDVSLKGTPNSPYPWEEERSDDTDGVTIREAA